MRIMRGVVSAIGNWATKIESWLALAGYFATSGVLAWLGQRWGLLAQQGWAAVLIFALIGGSLIILAISSTALAFRRNAPNLEIVATSAAGTGTIAANPPPLEMVQDTLFENRTVVIDGKHFVKCVFRNCTVQYSGGPYQITECRREAGQIVFVSHDQSIVRTLPLLNFIGLMREDASGSVFEIPKG